MSLIILVAALIVLVGAYFCFGIVAKFFLGWWIMVFGVPLLLIFGFAAGFIGAIFAIVGFFILLNMTNRWQGCSFYTALEQFIDKAFYMSDT